MSNNGVGISYKSTDDSIYDNINIPQHTHRNVDNRTKTWTIRDKTANLTRKLVRSDSFGPGCSEAIRFFLPPSSHRPVLRLTVALEGRAPVLLHPLSLPLSPSFALSTDPKWISTRSSLMSVCRSTLAKSVQHGSPGDRKNSKMCLFILLTILHFLFSLFSTVPVMRTFLKWNSPHAVGLHVGFISLWK